MLAALEAGRVRCLAYALSGVKKIVMNSRSFLRTTAPLGLAAYVPAQSRTDLECDVAVIGASLWTCPHF